MITKQAKKFNIYLELSNKDRKKDLNSMRIRGTETGKYYTTIQQRNCKCYVSGNIKVI